MYEIKVIKGVFFKRERIIILKGNYTMIKKELWNMLANKKITAVISITEY